MPPQKKSNLMIVIYGITMVIALLIAIHLAYSSSYAEYLIINGNLERSKKLFTVLKIFGTKISEEPLKIIWTNITERYLLYGLAFWIIIAASIESSRKNYIRGKEFGTARWGRKSDISSLFAETLEKIDITKAKRIKNAIWRWIQGNEVKRREKQFGKKLERQLLLNAEIEEEKNKIKGEGDKKLFEEKKKKIKEEVKQQVQDSINTEWKPFGIKKRYEEAIRKINSSKVYSKEEKEEKKKDAKKIQQKEMQRFLDVDTRIVEIKKKYQGQNILLTNTEHISFKNYSTNMNVLIVGGSGSGKTRGYAMPNILESALGETSLIITDPKGEILEKSGHFLEMQGYKIRVLNMDAKELSDNYNPFVYLHPYRAGYEERVLSLVETIIVNTDGGEKKSGSDPFWDKAERLFEQAIFFAIPRMFTPEEQNITTALEMIQMLNIKEDRDRYDSDLDYLFKIYGKKYGTDDIAYQTFKEFRSKASGKTAKSIVISTVARLQPFRTKEVRRIFAYDNLHLDKVGEEKTAIFVVTPPTDTTFNFIAGMFFTQIFQELQYCAAIKHKNEGQRLPVPVRFIIDEFANVCTIPNFVKILSYARSFGIGITIILQSLEQIKNMYKDEWGVIIDNCNSFLFLGKVTHGETLKYISELIGKGTFDKRTTGRTRGSKGSSSENFDVIGRELMTVDELRKLGGKENDKCLLIVSGLPVFYSDKYVYTKHPMYRYTSDADHSLTYNYSPKPYEGEVKSPHGEDFLEEKKKSLQPSERTVIDYEQPKVFFNPNTAIAYLANNADNIEFIKDDELAEDCELTKEEINNQFYKMVMEQEEKEASSGTKEILSNLRKKNDVVVNIATIESIGNIVSNLSNCEFLSDDEFAEDCELTKEEINESYIDFVFDEEMKDADRAEIESMLQDDFKNLASQIQLEHLDGNKESSNNSILDF